MSKRNKNNHCEMGKEMLHAYSLNVLYFLFALLLRKQQPTTRSAKATTIGAPIATNNNIFLLPAQNMTIATSNIIHDFKEANILKVIREN